MKLRNNNTLGMSAKTIALFLGASALSLTSCRDNDFDWESAHQNFVQTVESEYAEHFKQIFGEVDPNQNWDFTQHEKNTQGTRAVPDPLPYNGQVVGNPSTNNEWYEVKSDLINVFKTTLEEKNTNTGNLGRGSVYMVAPNSKFTIYPVFQGLSLNWDLYMKVGTQNPVLIWQKSHNIQAKDENNQWRNLGLSNNATDFPYGLWDDLNGNLEWKNGKSSNDYDFSYTYGSSGFGAWKYWANNKWNIWYGGTYTENGMTYANIPNVGDHRRLDRVEDIGYKTTCYAYPQMHEVQYPLNPIRGIRTKGYTFDLSEYAGQPVSFYLEINTRSKYYRNASLGAKMWSTTNQMRFINKNVSEISGLNFSDLAPLGTDYMLVGIEDADYRQVNRTWKDGLGNNVYGDYIAASDYDYNDLVLLIVSDDIKTVTDEYEEPVITKKRYMVEDLGTTDDIDFNDMVVDIEQTKWFHYKVSITNGEVTGVVRTSSTTNPTTQKVTLRAMGGTLDFDFKIGNEVIFTKSKLSGVDYMTMYNTGLNGGLGTLLEDYDSKIFSKTLTGNPWDPETNNVSFTVYKNGKSTAAGGDGTSQGSEGVVEKDADGIYNITFPEIGDAAPHMIAFPVTKLWRDERHECCTEWLYDREPALWEMPENEPDAAKNTHTESFANYINNNGRNVYLDWVERYFSTSVKNSMATWLDKFYQPSSTNNTDAGH